MKRYFLKVSGLVLAFGAFSIVGPAMAQQGPDQIVSGVPASQDASQGGAVTITARYAVSDGDNTLTGLGVRMHFDSSLLTWTSNGPPFGVDGDGGLIACDPAPVADGGNFDNDPATDVFVSCAWADIQGNWPNQPLPLNLYAVNFTSNLAVGQDTTVRFTASSTAAGYGFIGNPATVNYTPPPTYTLNVNSTGATGVTITANPATYGGATDYSHTGIPNGTNITLTAPDTAGDANFNGWSGCGSTSGTSCTVAMTQNRTATVDYTTTQPPPDAAQQIPVLGPFGLAALALLLGGMPFVFRRRK